MILSDIFSTSFMFSIGIIVILIGIVFAFISYRMAEQDHKITSMLGLISTMAEELQFFRSKLASIHNKQMELSSETHTDTSKLLYQAGSNNTDLISVSDEEIDSDEDEEDDNDDEEDDNDDEEDDDCDSDNECSIHYNISSEPINLCIDSEEILDSNESTMIKTIHLEEPINLLSDNLNIDYTEMNEDNLKSIVTHNLEETCDYKKMPLNKLRELVVEKGLTQNASKLKKNELLKIIEG